MDTHSIERSEIIRRLVIAVVLILAIIIGFGQSFLFLFDKWMTVDEYSHGPLLLLISLYVIWGKRSLFLHKYEKQSWIWIGLVVLGLLIAMAAQQTNRHTIVLFSLFTVLLGLILTIGGFRLAKQFYLPLALFILSIPMPATANLEIIAGLQRISSIIGAWMIDVSGIPVFLQGNIIQLAGHTLMVEEACSGLNYTFALLSIGVIWAYFFTGVIWQKTVLIAVTIPIAILTNSLRIAVTGLLVNEYGIEAAEGFLHEFEGWIVFLVAMILMIPVVWVLTKTLEEKTSLLGSFNPAITVNYSDMSTAHKRTSYPALVSISLILITVAIGAGFSVDQQIPERQRFETFPSKIGEWEGESKKLSPIIQDVLKADDYLIEDYIHPTGNSINLYLAYFAYQEVNKTVHSPLLCLPGGGWNIIGRGIKMLENAALGKIEVNRLITIKDDDKYLVYYWMQDQGLWTSNTYKVKLLNLFRSLFTGRTDGGLVRLMTKINNDDVIEADNILSAFALSVGKQLTYYFPMPHAIKKQGQGG